ncbi:chitin synthase chs-2-like [Littorina saxatilis]|uniref:chitin synthase chs-2-like n=1 Tax=Littorina saxatilis TaxID=31220 RepID=UPI0038B4C6C0
MWHETRKEMVQLMKSIFRMDIDRSARFIAQKYYNVKDPEYYDFEAHIFFDDAMQMSEDGLHLPNDFVTSLMECLDDAVSAVHERPTSLGDPVRTPTPYGGRLTWVLPGGTPLVVHLKDKNKIRHKKRWSQVMYMYYLLGYKILANSEMTSDQETEFDSVSGIMKKSEASGMTSHAKLTSSELRRRRTAAHFTRSVIFNYVPEEVHEQAENTYILALDGDVDFKPEAVRLLMDRMKKNKKVGAACGRIHPTGSGPMVWYQKFEYAVGHWLQKASEHVFGCVLCAPGCFTLFRGSALMDDNVARTYTTRSELAMHHVQYDQGEDRWLSTLLLQQGYRIDFCAASDALTHAPDTFSEFFNQRRRWGPSTLANVVDLLGNWQSAVRLNDNLSSLYVIYQAMMLCSTVLGPSTIILLMAGSFKMVFKISVLGSYALTLIVPALYVALCLYAKPRLQLTVGAGLSALYALVMAIVLVGTVGTVVLGSITSPNVLFLFTVIFVFTVSAVLHPQEFYCILPGVLYLIMLPAGYLVLTIYSLCNLHVVSWGTRETQTVKTHAQIEKEKQEAEEKKAGKKGGILGWLGLHATLKEARHLVKQARAGLFRKEKRGKSKSSPEKSRTDQLLEELIVEIRRDRECSDTSKRKSTSALNRGEHNGETNHGDKAACGREEEAHSDLTQSGTSRREDQERWSQHSQRPLSVHNQGSSSLRSRASSVNDSDNDSSDHEDRDTVVSNVGNHTVIRLDGNPPQPTTTQQPPRPPRHDDVTNPSWLTSEVCGEGPVTQLNERETAFWSQLIHKYLYPLNEDTAHQDKMQADLKSLRNNVVFGFVMVSVIWIALNMQLEALQDDLEMFLYIHIPRMTPGAPPHTFHPLGMVFLVSFALVLLVQFAGMFAHRWGTLLHTLSITEIGVGNSNDERKEVSLPA